MYKDNEDEASKERNIDSCSDKTDATWDPCLISAWTTQINVFLHNPLMHETLCLTFDNIAKYGKEQGFITNELTTKFIEVLESFIELDPTQPNELCFHFFDLLVEISKLTNGIALLKEINILDYINLMFDGKAAILCIPKAFLILTAMAKESIFSLVEIYEKVHFFDDITAWLPLQMKNNNEMFVFLLESIKQITPVETMQIIMIFVHLIISGAEISSNTVLYLDVISRILNHPLFNELIPNFINYEFPGFILFCLQERESSSIEEKTSIYKKALKCTKRLFISLDIPNEAYIERILAIYNEINELESECIEALTTIIENDDNGIINAFIKQDGCYHAFIGNIFENFYESNCKGKEITSELILFFLVHISKTDLIAFIGEFDVFPLIEESFSFDSHVSACISATDAILNTIQTDFPTDDVQDIISMIEDISNNEEMDENVVKEAHKFLETLSSIKV